MALSRIRRRRPPAGGRDGGAAGELLPGSAGTGPRQFKAFRAGLAGALGVGVGLLVWGAVSSLATLLTYIGIALFLALGLDPVLAWLEKRRVPRPAAVVLVFIGLLAVLAALSVWAAPVLIRQITTLIGQLPGFIEDVSSTQWATSLEVLVADYLDLDALTSSVTGFLSEPANLLALGGGVLAIGAGITNGLTGVLIVFILSLYFVLSLGGLKRAAYQLVPASRRSGFITVAEEIAAAVSRYIVGQFNLSLINGVLSVIFLSMISAPIPVLLAVVAFLGSLIPLIGTIAAAVIITLVCLIQSPETAITAGIYYLIYMQVEAYILTPKIMNKAVAVPGSLVVIAAIAGGTLGGILGALMAIPLAASAIIIFEEVVVPRQNRR